ncbi:MAG: hypothetical protein ACJ77K_19395 [Bacteroidia bacterium]
MRKGKIALFISLAATAGLMFFSGCRKNDRDEDKETDSARNNATAEKTYASVLKMIGQYADSSSYLRVSYPNFTVDSVGTASWPKTLTIDFGPNNSIGIDGALRKGKIIASFSGPYRDSLTTVTISLVGYYHNNNAVTVGSWSITNNGHNSSGNLKYTINCTNLHITTSEGNITWNSNRSREWIAGESTITDPSDDVYSIIGSANGTAANGNGFNVTIYVPLIVAMNCDYIEKGAIALSPFNLSTRYVDFGTGACDNNATVTINSVSYPITF